MSSMVSQPVPFYFIEVGPGGGFVVRASDRDKTFGPYHTQAEANTEAQRLNLAGGKITVEISETILLAAAERAEKDGASTADWINEALEFRIRAEKQADEFFSRAARGSPSDLGTLLNSAPNRPPDPGDELPEGWISWHQK